MSELEAKVWAAIEAVLIRVGDVDVRAGLAWLTDEDKKQIAQAAIAASQQ